MNNLPVVTISMILAHSHAAVVITSLEHSGRITSDLARMLRERLATRMAG